MNPEEDSERSEICRLQICNRLGKNHTCCTFDKDEFDLDDDNLS